MEINMKGYNLDSFKEKDIYSWDEIISIIEELESDKKRLEEEINDLEKDIQDNYKKILQEEQYGVNNEMFI